MKVLLDTHSFIWFIEGNSLLSQNARAVIEDENNEVCLRIASLWEMAIKTSIGKLYLSQPFASLIPGQIMLNDITVTAISIAHTITVAGLPFHHRDPFDRLLIAQSLTDNIPVIGVDSVFDQYGVTRIW